MEVAGRIVFNGGFGIFNFYTEKAQLSVFTC